MPKEPQGPRSSPEVPVTQNKNAPTSVPSLQRVTGWACALCSTAAFFTCHGSHLKRTLPPIIPWRCLAGLNNFSVMCPPSRRNLLGSCLCTSKNLGIIMVEHQLSSQGTSQSNFVTACRSLTKWGEIFYFNVKSRPSFLLYANNSCADHKFLYISDFPIQHCLFLLYTTTHQSIPPFAHLPTLTVSLLCATYPCLKIKRAKWNNMHFFPIFIYFSILDKPVCHLHCKMPVLVSSTEPKNMWKVLLMGLTLVLKL